MPEALKKLINSIGYLPGIGEKSAGKLAFFLLNANPNYLENLAKNIKDIKDKTSMCDTCFGVTDLWRTTCNTCANQWRDTTTIAVVEEYLDMLTIEQAWGYTGLYHILGWAISPVNWIFVADLKLGELFDRIEAADNNIELILAVNPNIEGEATINYIKEEVANRKLNHKTTITRLSRGLSSGYIEYADNITLVNALNERKKV